MQSCPKNVHTGPLTGDSKGPKMQPLPPVALALPHEPPGLPPGALGPPSPARGSAGMPPPPSPAAGGTHRYHAWDNMEGAKSVVKQDPGTPPEGTPPARSPPTSTPPCGLLAISKHDSPPTPLLGPPAPACPMGAARRKRDRPVKSPHPHPYSHPTSLTKGDAPGYADRGDAVKVEDVKDVKDVKGDIKDVSVLSGATTTVAVVMTTIEEATQTTPPPQIAPLGPAAAATTLSPLSPTEKRRAPPGVADVNGPPSKKKKKNGRKVATCTAEVVDGVQAAAKPKASKSKKKKKKVAEEVDADLHGVALPDVVPVPKCKAATGGKGGRKATAMNAAPGGAPTTASPSANLTASNKKRAKSRAPSLDSNKSAGSTTKRDKAAAAANNNNNDDTATSKSRDGSKSRSRSRSRSSSRSRLAEEEAAAAAVIAAAELPEGVPHNHCRRLIAAQKKLISKCLAKKEREQARQARQEAARAARLAALVSAAEAKKAEAKRAEAGACAPTAEQGGQGEAEVGGQASAERLSMPVAPTCVSAPAATPTSGKHHHNHHNHHHQDDPAVERSRVEELGVRAGLDVSACLIIYQSELRLLESCAEMKAPKWSNGWQWRGQPFLHRVFLNCDDPPVLRKCFPAMQHVEGDNITLGDTILLKSGTRKIDLPFVARVIHLWENPEDGEMMLSLVWFYRPEHTEQGRRPCDRDDEIFSSRHKDINSVACIEDKCYVLTFNEYCRYRKTIRRLEEGLSPPSLVVPSPEEKYPRHHRLPPGHVAPDMVFFCRKIYDFRQRRLQKNVF